MRGRSTRRRDQQLGARSCAPRKKKKHHPTAEYWCAQSTQWRTGSPTLIMMRRISSAEMKPSPDVSKTANAALSVCSRAQKGRPLAPSVGAQSRDAHTAAGCKKR
eukprot:2061751-Prymnesium_polylepis.1